MTVLIPNPNDEILLKKFQQNLIRLNNQKKIKLTPHFPLWYVFQDTIECTKTFVSNITEIKLKNIITKNENVVSPISVVCNDKSYDAILILAKKENPSDEIDFPSEGYISNINVFRIADAEMENHTWSVQKSFWKKF